MMHVNTKQAAELLGVSEATLNNWRSLRKGPAYRKLGGRVLYERFELEAWSKAQAVAHDDAA